jgi:hypothetical protein
MSVFAAGSRLLIRELKHLIAINVFHVRLQCTVSQRLNFVFASKKLYL